MFCLFVCFYSIRVDYYTNKNKVLCVCVCPNSILYTPYHTTPRILSSQCFQFLGLCRHIYGVSCEESDDVKHVVSVVVVSSRIESPLIDVDNFLFVCSYEERVNRCACNCRNQRRKKINPTAAAVGCQKCLVSGTRKPVTSLNPCCMYGQRRKKKDKTSSKMIYIVGSFVTSKNAVSYSIVFVFLTYPNCTTGTKHFQDEFRTIHLTTFPVTRSTGTDPIFRRYLL